MDILREEETRKRQTDFIRMENLIQRGGHILWRRTYILGEVEKFQFIQNNEMHTVLEEGGYN